MLVEALLTMALAAAPEAVGFEEAVERALAHNPSMQLAEADASRALALLEQARAPSLPTLNVNGGFTLLDNDRSLNGRLLQGRQQLQGNVQLSVPVVSTRNWANWIRADKTADGARATAADVKRQVAVLAARTWLAVLAQRRVVEAATTARDDAQAHLDYARERFAGGVGNKLDELRAAQELSVSATQLEVALGALVKVQESLGVVTGNDGPLDVSAGEPHFELPDDAQRALTGVDAARLDVKAARLKQDLAVDATHLDWMDYLPLVNAVFQPFTQNPPSATQPQFGWQLSLVLQIPLYDGGLRYGQAKARRADAKSAQAQFDAVLRQAKSEVRGAFVQVTHADLAMQRAHDASREAAEALELSNVAYRAGATTNLEVIDAERRARDARLQAALAEDSARQARLDLLVASGAFPK